MRKGARCENALPFYRPVLVLNSLRFIRNRIAIGKPTIIPYGKINRHQITDRMIAHR